MPTRGSWLRKGDPGWSTREHKAPMWPVKVVGGYHVGSKKNDTREKKRKPGRTGPSSGAHPHRARAPAFARPLRAAPLKMKMFSRLRRQAFDDDYLQGVEPSGRHGPPFYGTTTRTRTNPAQQLLPRTSHVRALRPRESLARERGDRPWEWGGGGGRQTPPRTLRVGTCSAPSPRRGPSSTSSAGVGAEEEITGNEKAGASASAWRKRTSPTAQKGRGYHHREGKDHVSTRGEPV
jgi:hypothetical protein